MNIKNKITGRIFSYNGTFENKGKTFYYVGTSSGLPIEHIEFTDEPIWTKLHSNLRMKYDESVKCTNYIESIGGQGDIIVGGSVYAGSKDMIDKLLLYMSDNNIDFSGLSYEHNPLNMERIPDRIKKIKNKNRKNKINRILNGNR